MALSTNVAQDLLERAHSPETSASLFKEKVLNKPLQLRPTSPDPGSQDSRTKRRLQRLRKAEKTKRRKKIKPLSAKEKRKIGIYDVHQDAKKYEIYKPLHSMWLGYMREILGLEQSPSAFITAPNRGSILASADYHGAELTVVRSRCASLVGLKGVVIRDTRFTFQIITKSDCVKIIPKRYTVFRFEISQNFKVREDLQESRSIEATSTKEKDLSSSQDLVFEIHGSQFENRATDRATKKFKPKHLRDL